MQNINRTYNVIVLQLTRVDAVRVVDAAIVLGNPHHLTPRPVQISHRVKTYITKTLDDDRLVTEAWWDSNHTHVLGTVDEVLNTVEHSLRVANKTIT